MPPLKYGYNFATPPYQISIEFASYLHGRQSQETSVLACVVAIEANDLYPKVMFIKMHLRMWSSVADFYIFLSLLPVGCHCDLLFLVQNGISQQNHLLYDATNRRAMLARHSCLHCRSALMDHQNSSKSKKTHFLLTFLCR